MKDKLSAAGRVSVEEVEKIDEAVKAASVAKNAKSVSEVSEEATVVRSKASATSSVETSKADFYVKLNGEVVPANGYRYTARNPEVLESARIGKLKSRPDGTYFSFDKMDDAVVAQGKLQIPYRPEYRFDFNTLNIIDDVSIPHGKWGTAEYLEPITTDFKKYGAGKASQAITYSEIESVEQVTKMR